MLVLGLGDGFKNQEIMKMRVSGLSTNEIGILLYQSEAEKVNEAITQQSTLTFALMHLKLQTGWLLLAHT